MTGKCNRMYCEDTRGREITVISVKLSDLTEIQEKLNKQTSWEEQEALHIWAWPCFTTEVA